MVQFQLPYIIGCIFLRCRYCQNTFMTTNKDQMTADQYCRPKRRWCHEASPLQQTSRTDTGLLCTGLPGRHVEKTDTLDLFPSSMREPKIEGLDLYTYVYICVRFELKFATGQVAPKLDSPVQNRTPGNPSYALQCCISHWTDRLIYSISNTVALLGP